MRIVCHNIFSIYLRLITVQYLLKIYKSEIRLIFVDRHKSSAYLKHCYSFLKIFQNSSTEKFILIQNNITIVNSYAALDIYDVINSKFNAIETLVDWLKTRDT